MEPVKIIGMHIGEGPLHLQFRKVELRSELAQYYPDHTGATAVDFAANQFTLACVALALRWFDKGVAVYIAKDGTRPWFAIPTAATRRGGKEKRR